MTRVSFGEVDSKSPHIKDHEALAAIAVICGLPEHGNTWHIGSSETKAVNSLQRRTVQVFF